MRNLKLELLHVQPMTTEEMRKEWAGGIGDWWKGVKTWFDETGKKGVEGAKQVQAIYKEAGIDMSLKDIMHP